MMGGALEIGDKIYSEYWKRWGRIVRTDPACPSGIDLYVDFGGGRICWVRSDACSTVETQPSAPSAAKACDCGGWSVGTHSHWCSNKLDNKQRPKGLVRKPS